MSYNFFFSFSFFFSEQDLPELSRVQASPKLDILVSASQILKLQACTTPSLEELFKDIDGCVFKYVECMSVYTSECKHACESTRLMSEIITVHSSAPSFVNSLV